MCTENYWTDIVESRDSHDWPDRPEDTRRKNRWKRRLGLEMDSPEWLVWRVTCKPPGPVNTDFRRVARNTLNRILRNAIAHGDDFEDVIIESRPSRLDARKYWY
jgi:hypothetical protein